VLEQSLKDEVGWIETLALALPLSYTRIRAGPRRSDWRLAYMPQISLECNKMVGRPCQQMICPLKLEYHGEIPNEPGSFDVHYHLDASIKRLCSV
jgi:hypothetical protein